MLDRRRFLSSTALGMLAALPGGSITAQENLEKLPGEFITDWSELWTSEVSNVNWELTLLDCLLAGPLADGNPERMQPRRRAARDMRLALALIPRAGSRLLYHRIFKRRHLGPFLEPRPTYAVRPGISFDWQIHPLPCYPDVRPTPTDRAEWLLDVLDHHRVLESSVKKGSSAQQRLGRALPALERMLMSETADRTRPNWQLVAAPLLADFDVGVALGWALDRFVQSDVFPVGTSAEMVRRAANTENYATMATFRRTEPWGQYQIAMERTLWRVIQVFANNNIGLVSCLLPPVVPHTRASLDLVTAVIFSVCYHKVRTLLAWRNGSVENPANPQCLPS